MSERKPNGFYSKMEDWEIVEYTIKNYSGISLGKLSNKLGDPTLYLELKKRKLKEDLEENGILVRVRKPLSWRTFEEWRDDGIKQGFEERNPTGLAKSEDEDERRWYWKGGAKSKGENQSWRSKFKFNRTYKLTPWVTFEEWRDDGIKKGYESRSPSSLETSTNKTERSWSSKGKSTRFEGEDKNWHSKFKFNREFELTPWVKFEEWRDDGIKQGFEERNPTGLAKSEDEDERRWYWKGGAEKWLIGFKFRKKKKEDSFFKKMEDWEIVEYTIQNYSGINLSKLARDKNNGDSTLYRELSNRNLIEDLVENNILIRKIYRFKWKTFEEWRDDGIEQGYESRSPVEFQKSKDKKERSWYAKGSGKKWIEKFKFKRKKDKNLWKTFEEWRDDGIEKGYQERSPSSLENSKNKMERAWHTKGLVSKWASEFNFNRMRNDGFWQTFEEWRDDGIERGYRERNPTSLRRSEDKYERSWLARGINKKWSTKFPFEKLREHKVWTKEILIDELMPLISQRGYLPSPNELTKMGRRDIVHAIYKFFNGFSQARTFLGAESPPKSQKEGNKLKILENLLEDEGEDGGEKERGEDKT